MPGKNPASATPRKKRTTQSCVEPLTSAVTPAKIPHVIMMRAIHSRAPTFSMMTLLGTSKMK